MEPLPEKTVSEKCRMIDWAGTVIFLAGSSCLTTAISFGGVVYDFSSATVIALYTAAGVFLIAMTVVSKLHPGVAKNNRLYPAHFFRRPVLMNLQLQVLLPSGIVLVRLSFSSGS